jgi:hypothetical protein
MEDTSDRKAPDAESGSQKVEKVVIDGSPPAIDGAALGVDEKRLVRKLDLHLVPLVMLLYLFSFLDR